MRNKGTVRFIAVMLCVMLAATMPTTAYACGAAGFSFSGFGAGLASALGDGIASYLVLGIGQMFGMEVDWKKARETITMNLMQAAVNGLTQDLTAGLQNAFGLRSNANNGASSATVYQAAPDWYSNWNNGSGSSGSSYNSPYLVSQVRTNADGTSVWRGEDGNYYKVDGNGNVMRKLADFEVSDMGLASGSGTGSGSGSSNSLDQYNQARANGLIPVDMTYEQFVAQYGLGGNNSGNVGLGSTLTGSDGAGNYYAGGGSGGTTPTVINVGGGGGIGGIISNPSAYSGAPVAIDGIKASDVIDPATGRWKLSDGNGKEIEVDFDFGKFDPNGSINQNGGLTIEGRVAIDPKTGKPYIVASSVEGSKNAVAAATQTGTMMAQGGGQPMVIVAPAAVPQGFSMVDAAAGATGKLLDYLGIKGDGLRKAMGLPSAGTNTANGTKVDPTGADRNNRQRVTRNGIPGVADGTVGANPKEVLPKIVANKNNSDKVSDLMNVKFSISEDKGDKAKSALLSPNEAWGEVVN